MGLTESSSAAPFDSVFVSPAEWDVNDAVVWLRGEHDLSTIPALSKTLSRAIAYDDGDLTLDLSEVLFIDAATVGTIVRTREFVRMRSRSLTLRSASRCARRLLDLCRLIDLIEPGPIEGTGIEGSAAALATWVVVPATVPSESADVFSLKPASAPETVLVVLDPTKQTVS